MASRRRGLGVEVAPGVVRAARLDEGDHRPTVTAEVAVGDGGAAAVSSALLAVLGQVGRPTGCPTRLAWSDRAVRLQAADVSDASPAELAERFRRWAETGFDAVTVVERRRQRWAVAVSWDADAVAALGAIAEQAGLERPVCEPAALVVARARAAGWTDDLDGAAHAAALAAAGAVPSPPLRPLTRTTARRRQLTGSVWVVEPVTDAAEPPTPSRSWRRLLDRLGRRAR